MHGGPLHFPWVVPYGIATLVLALAYAKFVWELPKDTRARFVTAGVTFLTDALGIEMLGAREADLHDTTTVTYCLLYSLEEVLEMLGIILFIYALLSHLAQETGRLSVVLELGQCRVLAYCQLSRHHSCDRLTVLAHKAS